MVTLLLHIRMFSDHSECSIYILRITKCVHTKCICSFVYIFAWVDCISIYTCVRWQVGSFVAAGFGESRRLGSSCCEVVESSKRDVCTYTCSIL